MKSYTQMKTILGFDKKVLLGALLATGMVIGSANVSALIDTQNLSVSATVSASCVFGAAATLPFGTLTISDLTAGKNELTPASVKITCSNTGVAAKLYAAATRQMTDGGTGTLDYEVYTDTGRTNALGSAVGTGADVIADGTEKTILLYGKTAASQAAKPAGSYTQNLLMTVEF
ncbi:MAG: spore coat protein U domain-containing protein [Methylobacter sp.]|jgi:spore coat protein U-like protein